jgi:hypothetical protein
MGSNGRSGVQRLLLGSVAEEVMRQAPCPVLIAPARPGAWSEDPDTHDRARARPRLPEGKGTPMHIRLTQVKADHPHGERIPV